MSDSMTLRVNKAGRDRWEYRVIIDRKAVRCGVVRTKQDAVSALDECYDECLERFQEG